ncbi:MAG: hypothetical protein IPJ88_13325 [Myxococcales bacterium]|nr:MAG: hypothetical protein IPJ88_13325 [Myxococcales bacterium]
MSCADQTPAVFITSNIKPADDCTVAIGGLRLYSGRIDTGLAQAYPGETSAYSIYPVFQSQLLARASQTPLKPDPNGFIVQGAEIELLAPDGSPLLMPSGAPNPYTITTTEPTFIPSSSDGAGVQQSGSMEIIPASYVEDLDTLVQQIGSFTLTAIVKAFGETTGGKDIDMNAWNWPISVVRLSGASVSFLGADDTEFPGPCDSTDSPEFLLCKPLGMDDVADCRYCRDSPNAAVRSCCRDGSCGD